MLPVSLEPFDSEAHSALLEEWLNRAHVKRWWLDPARNLAECLAGPGSGGHALICTGPTPVGYLRWALLTREDIKGLGLGGTHETAVDIDIMIGERNFAGRGIGPAALDLLLERLSAEHGALIAGLGTSVENRHAIRAFEKAGFRRFMEFEDSRYGRCLHLVRETVTGRSSRLP